MRYPFLILLLLLVVPLAAQAQDTPENPQIDAAQAIIQQFVDGDYAGIYAQFSDQIKAALSEDRLQGAWEGIVQSAGAFEGVTGVEQDAQTGAITLHLRFEKAPLDAHIAFDADGTIIGLNFTPAASDAASGAPTLAAPTPAYADPSSFTEQEVAVGEFDLPGILTMPAAPNSDDPVPAVVLISGSGPNDRDETIGPNKPFRDLAWGLAAQGIATLRFDKRTLAARESLDLATLTVKEEYLDDSLAAVDLLRQTDDIDPARVFILGHSLGGYVAPRIAAADPDIAGVILASALANPLQDAVLRQNQYILSVSGVSEDQQQETLAAVQQLVDQINSLTPDSPTDRLLLGAAPAYWLDLRDYDPAALAATLSQPILVLQGERDYQVTMVDDLPRWQSALAEHADVTFKTYPDLNHIYATGEGMSVPDEYNQPGNVAPEVIDDIAAWVKAR